MSSSQPLAVQICDINAANLKQLNVLNVSTLPVRYTDKFYKDLLTNGCVEYLKFASWNGPVLRPSARSATSITKTSF